MRAYRYATASLPHSRDGSSHDTHPLSWDTLNFWAILTQIAITMPLHSAYRFSTLATVTPRRNYGSTATTSGFSCLID